MKNIAIGRRALAIGAAIVCVLVLMEVLNNGAGSTDRAVASTRTKLVNTAYKVRVAQQLVRHLAILKGTRSPTAHVAAVSTLPADIQANLNDLVNVSKIGARLGLSSTEVQEVSEPSGSPVWIVPGSSGLCIIAESLPTASGQTTPVAACDNTATVLARGDITVGKSPTGGSYQIVGVIPNGNSDLSETAVSGGSSSLAVTDNVVDEVVRTDPSSASFTNASGDSVTIPIGG